MKPRSLISRLVIAYCTILALLGAAFLAFTVFSFEHYARQRMATNLAVRAREIWNIAAPILDKRSELAELMTMRFSPESEGRFIRIRRGTTVLYRSGVPLGNQFSPENIPIYPSDTLEPDMVGGLVFYSRDFESSKGTITVDTGQSYQVIRVVQGRLARSLFFGLPILLLAAGVAGWLVMRRALGPVETMIAAAESYSFNQPQARLPIPQSEPRIEALAMALNRLLDRLDGAYSHVSRFSSDAAHELRTPLMVIRGELDLMAQHKSLPNDMEPPIRVLQDEVAHLCGLVENLITLARMDSLWGKTSHQVVDLSTLVDETIAQLHLLSEEKQITITCERDQIVDVLGDRCRLKQVLVNLIDNAIKYTPAGGQISVNVFNDGITGVITVEDTGIGIDVVNHERIFDRFFRVSSESGPDGAGLGLAIVKSICQAHGGNVSIRSVLGIGSCFRIEIPLAVGAAVAETAKSPKPLYA